MNDLSKMQTQRQLDGFDTFDDAIESDGAEQTSALSSIMQGNQLKYGTTNMPFTWQDKVTGKPFSSERVLVAIDLLRVVQKWSPASDNSPPETRILAPGEKFPNVDKLNTETPEAEWRIGPDGKPKGPYENAYALYLLDPATMERFTYVATTIGGMGPYAICATGCHGCESCAAPTSMRGITLGDTLMPTKYGGRQRPYFKIINWIRFGDGGTLLPAPEQSTLTVETVEPPAPKASPQTATQKAGAQTVKESTLGEEMDDRIPW
jgi:hypothetical protein